MSVSGSQAPTRPIPFVPAAPAAVSRAKPAPAPAAETRPQAPVDRFESTPTTPAPAPSKPAPYDGLKDAALIKALHDGAAQHKDLGYNQARKIIFSALDNHDGKVKCVYTGREVKTDKIPNGSDMNTEHTWPQSQGATGPAKSDLHHLFPTDSKANSIRSSYPFGEVKNVQWTQNGAKFGTDASGKKVFEPPPEHKGNVARALFYFATVYGKHIPADDEAVLKKWNQADQVDAAERTRNDAIQGYQGNRNPFVDDPFLADRISDF